MQRSKPIFPPAPTLNSVKDAAKVDVIDYTADFENLFGRFDACTKFYNTGETKIDLVRYIPGLTKPAYLGQIDGTLTKKAYADDNYKDLKVAEFNIKLINNQYINFHNVYLVFPMKVRKSSNVNNNLSDDFIMVDNLFAQWIKKLGIERYGNCVPIIPISNTFKNYKYSHVILKHIESDALKTFQTDLWLLVVEGSLESFIKI